MKVLLFANIGSAPNKFYHVGDEAMFLETHRWYKKHHPKTKISILTSKPNHAHLKINEIISPIEFQYVNKIFLFRFIVYYLLYKITKINRLSKQENELIYVIKKQDRIHLCGGGNLTSVYPDWLYYSFLVLITAILLSKEIIITSQTIGPFNKVDKLLSFFILNKAKIIAVRGHADTIKNLGIYKRNIYNMLDAAYLLPSAKIESKKDPGEIIIGLSLHDWSKSEFFYSSLVKAISSVAKSYKIKLLLIPHVIVDNEDQWDMGFMKNLFFSKNSGISVIKPEISEILGHKPEPAYYIKGLTKSVNFIISTRYHGLIFALSENIPA
ncbi:MAG: polysaccharide pyruvyl transferase family protein, partial [Patescibacteria group bacterium]